MTISHLAYRSFRGELSPAEQASLKAFCTERLRRKEIDVQAINDRIERLCWGKK